MIIQYCSDLHLEFRENLRYITTNPIPPLGDVLILAGDVTTFTRIKVQQSFFDYLSDNFKVTYWIPGNHEYYDGDIRERAGSIKEKIRDNVLLVNNQSFMHGTTRIICSTLWSHISEATRTRAENSINDFNAILLNGKRFSTDDFNELHKTNLVFLKSELEDEWVGTTIVATHHVPTLMNYPKKYKNDPLNEVFASEQSQLILRASPDYWIYGHHHTNIPRFSIGKTQLLTNQLGYVRHHEHSSFNNSQCVTVAGDEAIA